MPKLLRAVQKFGAIIMIFFLIFFSEVKVTQYPLNLKDDNESDVDPVGVDYTKFTSYASIIDKLSSLATNYSHYAELINLNTLYGISAIPAASSSYDLYVLRLTNESMGLGKPEVFIMGGIHGDECTSPSGYTWFCDWFLRYAVGYSEGGDVNYSGHENSYLQYLLNTREIYVMPVFNPEGFDTHNRYDNTDRDLNRDFDMDCADTPMETKNGEVLKAFVNAHQFRIGVGGHDGAHFVCYPMDSIHASASASTVAGTYAYPGSPNSRIGITQNYCPPDYYFMDLFLANMINYTGSTPDGWWGASNEDEGGFCPGGDWYEAQGCLDTWIYAANEPNELPYIVNDNQYPGAGVCWYTVEYSNSKNTPASEFGDDSSLPSKCWVAGIKRQLLYTIDMAQPYLGWIPSNTPANHSHVQDGTKLKFRFQVNGCLVVDEARIQYGLNSSPSMNFSDSTPINNTFQGLMYGGAGTCYALDGQTTKGAWFEYEITMPSTPGHYYFTARAKVDQFYDTPASDPSGGQYTEHTYLRMIRERAQSGWSESIIGTDGTELMQYQEYWYSPVIHIEVI